MGSDSGNGKDKDKQQDKKDNGPSFFDNFVEDLGNLFSGNVTSPHSAYDVRNAEAMAEKHGRRDEHAYKDYLPGGKYGRGSNGYNSAEFYAAGQNQEYARRAAITRMARTKEPHYEAVLDDSVGPLGLNASADVAKVQEGLNAAGLNVEADGVISTETVNKTKAFQQENGLKVDGQVNPGGPTERALQGRLNKSGETAQMQPGQVSIERQVETLREMEAAKAARQRQQQAAIAKARQRTSYASAWQQELAKPPTERRTLKAFAADYHKANGITSGYAPNAKQVASLTPPSTPNRRTDTAKAHAPNATQATAAARHANEFMGLGATGGRASPQAGLLDGASHYKNVLEALNAMGYGKPKSVRSLPHVPQRIENSPLDPNYDWEVEKRALSKGSAKELRQAFENFEAQTAFDPGVRERLPEGLREYLGAYQNRYHGTYGNIEFERRRNAHLAGLKAANSQSLLGIEGDVVNGLVNAFAPTSHKTHLAEINILHNGTPAQKADLYEHMARVLMTDPKTFEKYPGELKGAYTAYQKYARNPYTGITGYPVELERYGLLAGDEASAGTYTMQSLVQKPLKSALNAAAVIDLTSPNGADWSAFDRQLGKINALVPDNVQFTRGHQAHTQLSEMGFFVGRRAGPISIASVPLGVMSSAGEIARDLAKRGVSVEGQRIGAAVVGLTSAMSGKLSKNGVRLVNKGLKQTLGKSLKELTGKDFEIINEILIGEGINMTTEGLVKEVAGSKKGLETEDK